MAANHRHGVVVVAIPIGYFIVQNFSYDTLYGAVGPVLFADPVFWFMGVFTVPIVLVLRPLYISSCCSIPRTRCSIARST